MGLFLNNHGIQQVLDVRSGIESLEEAYAEMARGRAVDQLRMDTQIPVESYGLVNGRYEFKTMVGICTAEIADP